MHVQGGRSAKKPIETGTQGKDDIDYQWLPEGTIPSKSLNGTLLWFGSIVLYELGVDLCL